MPGFVEISMLTEEVNVFLQTIDLSLNLGLLFRAGYCTLQLDALRSESPIEFDVGMGHVESGVEVKLIISYSGG